MANRPPKRLKEDGIPKAQAIRRLKLVRPRMPIIIAATRVIHPNTSIIVGNFETAFNGSLVPVGGTYQHHGCGTQFEKTHNSDCADIPSVIQ